MPNTIQIISGFYEGMTLDIEDGQEIHIGRSRDNHFFLTHDACLSGKHAVIKQVGNLYSVQDLGSSNGTFVDCERLRRDQIRDIDDYFVLGSTIFKIVGRTERCVMSPIPAESHRLREWHRVPIFNHALKLAQDFPFLTSSILFLSLIELHGEELRPFLDQLAPGWNLEDWRLRITNFSLFEGSPEWLNYFLSFQAKMVTPHRIFVTPKVQSLMTKISMQGKTDPALFLTTFLEEENNLIFNLFNKKRHDPSWPDLLAQIQLYRAQAGPEVADLTPMKFAPHLILPVTLWQDVAEACKKHPIIVLAGVGGCGKSAILRAYFNQERRLTLPSPFREANKVYHDPKVIPLLAGSEKGATPFLPLAADLAGTNLMALDHFDFLLDQLRGNERQKVLNLVRERKGPLLLAIRAERAEEVRQEMPDHAVFVDMSSYLSPHLDQIHENLIDRLQERIGCTISEKAREFILEHVCAPVGYDFGAIQSFIDMASFDFDHGHLGTALPPGGGAVFGPAFFSEIYPRWRQVWRTSGRRQEDRGDNQEAKVLEQVEELVDNFAKHLFKIHLRYSDGSRSFMDPGRMSREQKLEELKSRLIYLLSTFKSSFRKWFREFWEDISPDEIQANVTGAPNFRKLWQIYASKCRTIDENYTEDRFHDIAGKVFLEQMKHQQPQDLLGLDFAKPTDTLRFQLPAFGKNLKTKASE